MKKIPVSQIELMAELNRELEKLTASIYSLLDDVMDVRLEQKDGYSAHVKTVSSRLIEDAMRKNED
jgi:hypothetical protein